MRKLWKLNEFSVKIVLTCCNTAVCFSFLYIFETRNTLFSYLFLHCIARRHDPLQFFLVNNVVVSF